MRPAYRKLGLLAIPAVILLFLGISAISVVPAGEVGVLTAFGQVQAGTLAPGLHFVTPIVNQVHLVDTRVQPHEFKEIDAASSEYQSVKLTGVMNYHIDGQYASDLYQRVGDDFAAKILDPAFNDFIKSVVPTYSVGEILGKRDEIRAKAKADLQTNLSQYHIVVDDIYIANIAFSDAYEAAIEDKQVAQQKVQTEQQILAQKNIQAQQAAIDAQGQANAAIESAKGQAQSTLLNAQAQAQANKLLNDSLTPLFVQYTQILKINPNVQVIYLPETSTFFLNNITQPK
jgi:regulator of protease activity HflC (stomatin/prohibitin superfamily)